MSLTAAQRDYAESFRTAIEDTFSKDARFSGSHRHDRPDGSTLATRWQSVVNPQVWFEIAVRPLIPQVRVGILTDDRWKSEDLEEKIEESGDSMSEFVEMGFEDAGLAWPEPTVEHYREDTKYFYFATAFEPARIEELASHVVREKAGKMLEGYYHAFGPFLK